MVEADFRNMEITVVGLGLIGGSFVKALSNLKLKPRKIWAVDKNEEVLRKAEKTGLIEKGFTVGSYALQRSDLVIIALYPEATVNFVKEYLGDFKPNALLTDTAGIKFKVLSGVNEFLRPDLEFIGGHPLAGKEHSGFDYSSAEIFFGANYILTPIDRNKKENVELLKKMIKEIGCKKVVQMSPEEHDKIIALTSQLPHVIAASLVNSNSYPNIKDLCGGSFLDATRVAPMNVHLWSELFLENKQHILTYIDIFLSNMNKIKSAIENNDSSSLRDFLARAGNFAKN